MTKVMLFGENTVIETQDGSVFSTDEKLQETKIASKRVICSAVADQVRCYVTSDGHMHVQGLYENLNTEADNVAPQDLRQVD